MTIATPGSTRRQFVKNSASVLALACMPGLAAAQSGKRIRLEWQDFKRTTQYPSFLSAVQTMRANTNSGDRNSWQYWVNVHVNYCPHSVPYFIAWHRGYIYYLEKQLRAISGNNALNLPYWDYYTNPTIPGEFTDQATGNPLYAPRANTNVYNALSLAPFAAGVFNFQRGTANAFEPQFEAKPHNPVHDIIGGVMATMRSPIDPIFYLHHCNVDRLTHAWALPDGKGIPYTANPYSAATSSAYWAGTHRYASGLTMARSQTYDPAYLGYDYADHNLPTALPMAAGNTQGGFIKVQSTSQPAPDDATPQEGNFASAPGRVFSPNRRSLGSAKDVDLDETSVTARIKLGPVEKQILHNAFDAAKAPDTAASTHNSVGIVFDNITVNERGKQGGYFYNVYVGLPAAAQTAHARQPYFIGTLGAFAIDAAGHHGTAMIRFPVTDVMAGLDLTAVSTLSVSLVRVNGRNAPKGKIIRLGEVRLEVAQDVASDPGTPTGRLAAGCRYDC